MNNGLIDLSLLGSPIESPDSRVFDSIAPAAITKDEAMAAVPQPVPRDREPSIPTDAVLYGVALAALLGFVCLLLIACLDCGLLA